MIRTAKYLFCSTEKEGPHNSSQCCDELYISPEDTLSGQVNRRNILSLENSIRQGKALAGSDSKILKGQYRAHCAAVYRVDGAHEHRVPKRASEDLRKP